MNKRSRRQPTPGTDATSADHAGAPSGSGSTAVAGKPRRRRLRRVALVLLILVLLVRVTLWLALPGIVSSLAESLGWRCGWDRLECSVLGGELELAHLELAPLSGPGPELHVEYAHIDVATLALLTGELVVRRVEVDGLDLALERDADGRIVLPRSADGAAPEAPADEPPADDADTAPGDGSLDLSPPFRLDAARLQHVQVSWVDHTQQPPLSTRVDLDLRVSDLGVPDRDGRVSITLAARGLLDRLSVELGTRVGEQTVDADLTVRMGGLRLLPLAALLAPLGVEPLGPALDLDLDGTLALRGGDAPGVDLSLTGFQVLAGRERPLAFDSVSLSAARAPNGDLDVSLAEVLGLRANATATADGSLRVAGLALHPVAPGPEPPPAPDTSAPSPGDLILRRLHLADHLVTLVDESVSPPAPLSLGIDDLSLTDVTTGPLARELPSRLKARLTSPGLFESLELQARALPVGDGGPFELTLAMAGLEPRLLEARLARAGVISHLQGATLGLLVRGEWELSPEGDVLADVRLENLELGQQGDALAGLGSLRVDGLRLAADGSTLHVEELGVSGVHASASQLADGTLRLPGIDLLARSPAAGAPSPSASANPPATVPASSAASGAAPATGSTSGPAAAPTSPAPSGPHVTVSRLVLEDNRLRWTPAGADTLSFDDLDITLTAVDLPPGELPTIDEVALALSVPGLVERLRVGGRLEREGDEVHAAIDLSADGLQTDGLGLGGGGGPRPELRDGRLVLGLDGRLVSSPDGLQADLRLDHLALSDAGAELLGFEALTVSGVDLRGVTPVVAAVQLDHLRVAVTRDADGGLHLPAFFVPPAAAPTAPTRATLEDVAREAANADATGASAPGVGTTNAGANSTTASTPAAGTTTAGTTSAGTATAGASAPAVGAPAAPLAPAVGSEPESAAAVAATPPVLELGRLALHAAEFHVVDRAVADPLDERLTLEFSLDGLSLSDAPPPARLALALGRAGSAMRLALEGDVTPSPVAPAAALQLSGEGLDLAVAAAYLPPGMLADLSDGRLAGQLGLTLAPAPDGGQSLQAGFTAFSLRDGADDRELVGFDRLTLDAPRLDGEGGVFHVAEVAFEGLRVEAQRDADGVLHVPGFALHPAPAGEPSVGPEVPTEPVAPPGPAVAVDHSDAPELRVGRVVFGVQRVTLRDAGREPLVLHDLVFENQDPITLTDDEEPAPFGLTLRAAVDPLLDLLAIDIKASPFAVEPTLTIDLALDGLRGTALSSVMPELDGTLDASGLVDGRLRGTLRASWLGRRRGPLHFDTSSGVPLDVRLDGLSFRDGEQGENLLGLSSLRLDVAKALGPLGALKVRSLELEKPVARVRRVPGGLEVLHVVLLDPPPGPPEAEPASGAVATAATPELSASTAGGPSSAGDGGASASVAAPLPGADTAAAGGAPAGPAVGTPVTGTPVTGAPAGAKGTPVTGTPTAAASGASAADASAPAAVGTPAAPLPVPAPAEQAIERLLVSGADILFVDTTTDPPLELPIVGLDVDVRDLTSRALLEPLPVAFDVFVRAGKPSFRSRPVFQELALSGVLSLTPHPVGRAKLEIAGFDLPALRGPAGAAGVQIADGLLDGRVDLVFQDDGDLDIESDMAFADLDVSEPEDGPISRFLKLPSPLGTVLFVLRDENGVIDIPLSLEVAADGMAVAEISRLAVVTLGKLIAQAIANTPFRVVGGITDTVGSLIGFGGEEQQAVGEPQRLEFAPGGATPPVALAAGIAALAQRLEDEDDLRLTLRHDLGSADVALLALRANPPTEQVVDLTTRMRVRKGTLELQRADVATRLGAVLSAGLVDEVGRLSPELAALDGEIGRLERALDALLEVLRPGSEGMAERRTRAMGVVIAQERLDAIAAALRAGLDPDQQERVRVVAPRPGDDPTSERGAVTAVPSRGGAQ